MKHVWGLQMPSVIFDVTGGAVDFELRPVFLELFKSSLLKATRNTNSWVVTGGTDKGIMKLVGDALSEVQSAETTLAIASWGIVHGRSSLTRQSEKLPKSCTVIFDGAGRDTAKWCGKHKVSLPDTLRDNYSKFGVVAGFTYLRCYPQTPAHPRGQVEQVLPGEDVSEDGLVKDPKSQCKYFGFVSFTEPAEAHAALELQKITVLGRSIPVNTRVVNVPGSGRLHAGDSYNNDYLNAQLEKRGLQLHSAQILASRGSVAWPFGKSRTIFQLHVMCGPSLTDCL